MTAPQGKPLSTVTHGPHIIERFPLNVVNVRRTDGSEPTKAQAVAAADWYWQKVGIRHTAIAPNDPAPDPPKV